MLTGHSADAGRRTGRKQAQEQAVMTALWAVYRRELAAYFETPLAWVFLTAFSIAAPSFAWHVGGLFETGARRSGTFV